MQYFIVVFVVAVLIVIHTVVVVCFVYIGICKFLNQVFSKLLPFGVSKNREAMGVFNHRCNPIKHCNIFQNTLNQEAKLAKIKTFFTVVLIFQFLQFQSVYPIQIFFKSMSKFISLPVIRFTYICVLLKIMRHIWLFLIIFNRSGDTEKKSWTEA